MNIVIINRFRPLFELIRKASLKFAAIEQHLSGTMNELRKIVPDISQQESGQSKFNEFWELKRRVFACFSS